MWNKLVGIFGSVVMVTAVINVFVYIFEKMKIEEIIHEKELKEEKKPKLVIITGASSGLGYAYAGYISENKEEFGADRIILIARRKKKLEELQKSLSLPSEVYAMDISSKEEMREFEKYLKEKTEEFEIKYLINAAGFGIKGKSTEMSSEVENRMIEVNCQSQINMIETVQKLMKAGGNIIQIASVAGFHPVPRLNAYSASKTLIYTYSRGLREELSGRGINVTTVCPYFVDDTEFFDVAGMRGKKYFLPCKKDKVVKKSLNDTKKCFAVSTPGFVATADRIFSGLIPDGVLLYIMRAFL